MAEVSLNFREAAYAQETEKDIITLLTLSVEGDEQPVQVCDTPYQKLEDMEEDVYGVISNGKTYIFVPMEITLPQDDKTGNVSAKISIDNVDRRIIQYARRVLKPIKVSLACVLSSDVDVEEISFDNFQLININYDGFKIEGDLSVEYLGSEPFPSGRFTPSGFQGLFS